MSAGERDVWTHYWSAPGARPGAGCLPNAAGPLESAQRDVWQRFARRLPRRARVLDLATGNGVVIGWMAGARRDLDLVGVDSAASLPPPPKGTKLKAGVRLERLPFGDSRFDAATSQFGFEYAETQAAAAELARVLRPGAAVLMMVHHLDSFIVAHNRSRAEALRWVSRPDLYLDKAVAFVGVAGALPIPPLFRGAPAEAQRRFPGQPAAAEFAMGLLQRLEAGRSRGPTAAQAMIRALAGDARSEIARIEQLEQAARDSDGARTIADQLSAAGFAMDGPSVLPDREAGRPLAWLLSGTR